MNIDPLSNHSQVSAFFRRHAAFADQSGSSVTNGGDDQLSAERSNSVRETLAALPEVRPEVVERGRQLLADPNYPGPDVVQKIAALITPLSEE